MTMHRLGAGLLLLAALPPDPPYAGPWDAQTEAAAEAAVRRLGPRRALVVHAVVVRIVGLEGTAGTGTAAIAGTVHDVERAMQELGATETPLEVRVALSADVLFDFDRAEIRPAAAPELERLTTVIRGYPAGVAVIEGHTDSLGTDAYNLALSGRRAETVKRWLVQRAGLEPGRIATRGMGESDPVAPNGTEEGRQRNRRVEVVVTKNE